MRKYKRQSEKANAKKEEQQPWLAAGRLATADFIAGAREDIERFAAELGLTFIRAVLEEEIQNKLGKWGERQIHRHGHQAGYVVYGGRKLRLERPRLRSRENKEVLLASYQAFQKDGRLQRAVARNLSRKCSTRDYEGALEDCLEGYGIKKSSVSRHWKAATAQELKKLAERPVPKDLVALMIDSKFFGGECIVAAVGIDLNGKKHVLGIWHGATENSTVVKGLLEDLVSRGLETERPMLIVMDGAKALRKAVQMVFGERALIQRCRIHKERNVLEQLPEDKKAQARWRLRAAWAQKDPAVAEKELRKTARWLEGSWPNAAASLLEGLEETLTVQKLQMAPALCRILSNTNLMENCFAQAAAWTQRVKRWQGADMILRWAASALLAAEKKFRRIFAAEQLINLEKALRKHELTPIINAA